MNRKDVDGRIAQPRAQHIADQDEKTAEGKAKAKAKTKAKEKTKAGCLVPEEYAGPVTQLEPARPSFSVFCTGYVFCCTWNSAHPDFVHRHCGPCREPSAASEASLRNQQGTASRAYFEPKRP